MEVAQDDEPSPSNSKQLAISRQSRDGSLLNRVGSLNRLGKTPSKSLNVVRVRQNDGVVTFRDKRQPLQQYEANLIIQNHY